MKHLFLYAFCVASLFLKETVWAESAVTFNYKRYLHALQVKWPTNIAPQVVTNNRIQGADLNYISGYVYGTNHVLVISQRPISIEVFLHNFDNKAIYNNSNALQLVAYIGGRLWCATFARDTLVNVQDQSLFICDWETKLHSSAFEAVTAELQASELLRLGILYAMPHTISVDLAHQIWTATNRFCDPINGHLVVDKGRLEFTYSVGSMDYKVVVYSEKNQIDKLPKMIYSSDELFSILQPNFIEIFAGKSSRPFCVYERDQISNIVLDDEIGHRLYTNILTQLTFHESISNNAVSYLDKDGRTLAIRRDINDAPLGLNTSKTENNLILCLLIVITISPLCYLVSSKWRKGGG